MFVFLNLFLVAYVEVIRSQDYCKLDIDSRVQFCFDPGYVHGLRRCNSYEFEDVILRPGCNSPRHRSNSSLPPMRCVNGKWVNLYECKQEPVNGQSRPYSDRPTQQTDRAPVRPLDENPSTTRPVQIDQPVETPRPHVTDPPSTTRPVQTQKPVETPRPQVNNPPSTTRPAQTNQPVETPRPQVNDPPSITQPAQTEKPVETPRPQKTEPPLAQPSSECGVPVGGIDKQRLESNEAYPRGDMPWIAAIYKDEKPAFSFVCGGTLVSDRHVVTAAHCMRTTSGQSLIMDFVVMMGVHSLDDWGDYITVIRSVVSAAIHDSYNPATLDNDLLVFTLDRIVVFNNHIRPACLWTGNTAPNAIVGAIGVAVGWGNQSDPSRVGLGVPHKVRLPILSNAACTASNTARKTLCAGDRGSSSCEVDFGGGLYLVEGGRWRLRGVVSRAQGQGPGEALCKSYEYVVLVDTAQYVDWIRNVISS